MPLRDAFVALFFVSLGTLIDPKVLFHSLPLLGLMLLLIVVGKFLVWTMIVWIFRYPIRTAIAVAAGLTQIGEFSFVVMQAARSSGMSGRERLQPCDRRIVDFDIAERVHRSRHVPMARPKVS